MVCLLIHEEGMQSTLRGIPSAMVRDTFHISMSRMNQDAISGTEIVWTSMSVSSSLIKAFTRRLNGVLNEGLRMKRSSNSFDRLEIAWYVSVVGWHTILTYRCRYNFSRCNVDQLRSYQGSVHHEKGLPIDITLLA